MADSDSSMSPVNYASIDRFPEESKNSSVQALNNYLKNNMHSIQIQTLSILIANVGIGFGENSHTWKLAKNYLQTIETLKDHQLATANALVPLATNLCYPSFGGQPILLRRHHARHLNEQWFQRRLRWNKSLYGLDSGPDTMLLQAVEHFKAHAPGSIQRDLKMIFPESFSLRLRELLCQ